MLLDDESKTKFKEQSTMSSNGHRAISGSEVWPLVRRETIYGYMKVLPDISNILE